MGEEKKSCIVCAWREDCARRFSGPPDEVARSCIEFTYDIRLRRRKNEPDPERGDKGNNKKGD